MPALVRLFGRLYPGRVLAAIFLPLLICAQTVNAQDVRESRSDGATGMEIASAAQSFAQTLADRAVLGAQELAMYAMGLIGIRYTFGGRSPETGSDCSGLVRYVFNRVTGRALPHNSIEMAQLGESIAVSELQPGDLVFYNTRGRRFSHVGIYIGEGRFIHAPSRGGRVHIVDMQSRYWVNRFNGARRLTT